MQGSKECQECEASAMTKYWLAFRAAIAFLQRRRERLNAQREAERKHQLEMLDVMFGHLAAAQRAQLEAITQLANAQVQQAEVLASWVKGFVSPSPDQPMGPVIQEPTMVDEWIPVTEGGLDDFLPAGLREAYRLHNNLPVDFDREGSDFN